MPRHFVVKKSMRRRMFGRRFVGCLKKMPGSRDWVKLTEIISEMSLDE